MPPRRKNPWKPKSKPRVRQVWVKKPTYNWLELPADVTANILHRLGAIEILESAQKVCTSWHKICKDPSMWRVIDMHNSGDMPYDLEKMCKHAVDLSQGQLVDINIEYSGTDELLRYVVDRSSQLRRLQVVCCYGSIYEAWSDVFKKLPLLEELSLVFTGISKEAIADAGRYCPLLKSFKLNTRTNGHQSLSTDNDNEWLTDYADEEVQNIAGNMPQLQHLQLIASRMTNKGLQAILDGCPHLESLDLRRCINIKLEGSLGKRCSEQIKELRLPSESIEDYPFKADYDYEYNMMTHDYCSSDYEGLSDYDSYGDEGYNPYEDTSDFDVIDPHNFCDFDDLFDQVGELQFYN